MRFIKSPPSAVLMSLLLLFCCCTYRQGGVVVQLVFSSNAKASVVTAGCPGQSYRCFQLVVDLLVDGATELCPVITERERRERRLHSQLSLTFDDSLSNQ